MRRAILLSCAALLLAPSLARAQQTSTVAPALIPPRPLEMLKIEWPLDAVARPGEIFEVTVRIRVGADGQVELVELVRGAGPRFDHLVLEAAARFRFEPATYGGLAVPVDINYTQRFVAPTGASVSMPDDPDEPGGLRSNALLTGSLIERGTKKVIAHASVIATIDGRAFEATSNEQGEFHLPLAAGTATVAVISSAHRRFVQLEQLGPGEMLNVKYLLQRERYDPYEILVIGKRERTEVARTTLRGKELSQVAGTFGDPFRVIGALPGVSSMMSLVPFPIVRGSSPGNTGFLIDGVRVPLLFHLLAGPSVVHPEFIDAVEFSPGGFSAEYGGYIGGIVDGKTRAATAEEHRFDLDLNLLQVGAFYRRPIAWMGGTGTIAGRIGYPGLLVSLASPRVGLSYWDYQARFDGGSKTSGWTVFLFGANDSLDAVPVDSPDSAEKKPLLHFGFHRLDFRYHTQHGEKVDGNYHLTLGFDQTLTPDLEIGSASAVPRFSWKWALADALELRGGVTALLKVAEVRNSLASNSELSLLLGSAIAPSDTLLGAGVYIETLYRPAEDWLLRPGVRVDIYDDTRARHVSIDPRLLARYRLAPDLWMKSSVGLYHQPPRFTIPLPGLDEIAFEKGLLQAVQVMFGGDAALGSGWTADVQGYFNWMDPILYDTQINPDVEDLQNTMPEVPPGEEPPPSSMPAGGGGLDDRLGQLLAPATGRSYGLELLLRHQSRTGVSGWLAYTFSRSERLRDGRWSSFDFDRTHILNFVVNIPLPRDWQLGLRAQIESGRPVTTASGLGGGRTDPFVRLDLRIDKTAVWNDWLLDFYVDIANVILGAEELTTDNEVRYVFPTVGFRGQF